MAFARLIRDLEYQELPEALGANQFICQNLCPMGHSLFKVRLPTEAGQQELFVQLPQKWKRKILFGRRDLCVATFPDGFETEPDCIGNITMLLTKKNVQQLKKDGRWEAMGFLDQFEEEASEEQGEEALAKEEQEEESSLPYY